MAPPLPVPSFAAVAPLMALWSSMKTAPPKFAIAPPLSCAVVLNTPTLSSVRIEPMFWILRRPPYRRES